MMLFWYSSTVSKHPTSTRRHNRPNALAFLIFPLQLLWKEILFISPWNEFTDASYRDYFLLEFRRKIVRVNRINLVKVWLLAVGQVYIITDLTFDHIFTPRKPMSTEAIAEVEIHLVFEEWQFPIFPSRAVNIYLLYWMLIRYIVYITFGFKTFQVKWIFEFVFRTP